MEAYVPGRGVVLVEVTDKDVAEIRYKRKTMRANRLLKQAKQDGSAKRVKYWEKALANC